MFLNNRLFVMNIVATMQHFNLRCVFLHVFLPESRRSQLPVQRTLHLRFFLLFFISGFTGLSGEDTYCAQ